MTWKVFGILRWIKVKIVSKEQFKTGEEYFRSLIFLSPLILLFFISLFQVFNLTVLQGDKFQTIAESNRIYQKPINPVRGFIYDRKGNLLAENIVQRDLYVTPAYILDSSETLLTVSYTHLTLPTTEYV